jgi:hypothetical protein
MGRLRRRQQALLEALQWQRELGVAAALGGAEEKLARSKSDYCSG